MSRTIVGKFLASALVIAPAFYCAPGWAQPAKAVEEIAPKFKEEVREKIREWLGKAPKVGEDIGNEELRKAIEALADCVKKHTDIEDCTNAPK